MMVIGVIINLVQHKAFTLPIILGGMISGILSEKLCTAFKKLLSQSKK